MEITRYLSIGHVLDKFSKEFDYLMLLSGFMTTESTLVGYSN